MPRRLQQVLYGGRRSDGLERARAARIRGRHPTTSSLNRVEPKENGALRGPVFVLDRGGENSLPRLAQEQRAGQGIHLLAADRIPQVRGDERAGTGHDLLREVQIQLGPSPSQTTSTDFVRR